MKINPNIKLNRHTNNFIALFLLGFVLYSCQKTPQIIPPKAEITNIYNITDSTANVDVQVTQQSNAEDEGFGLEVDSISNIGNSIQIQFISFTPQSVTKLNSFYSTKISKLRSKTKYSLTLYFEGTFDLGGPTGQKDFNIGATKTFTTN